ncbi:hotdog fold thioesterase [Rosenbergiella australiborealis]|uniref:Hotdog fold thioesterase n=1 Tax=Rosenbergiella australiborealis TaxID=1544696 RepID=A0ABS5T2X6_9GAMM|nr:hotdog fold thioesterase [Rosenbergiella australiborealis]MBT0725850.1 hotdog fold thioesterase [Rosenbergiella australiborealis]
MQTIWKKAIDIDALNQMGENCLIEHLGIRFTAITATSLEAEMPVDSRTQQPFGLLHGGASVVLAESMGSMAGWLTCREEQSVVGVEVNASHHRAVASGKVTAVCQPLHLGGQLQVWQIEIKNIRGKLCCSARLTVALLG